MFTENAIKIIGISATVMGIGATIVGDWVSEKKTDSLIEKKVAEAIAKIKG